MYVPALAFEIIFFVAVIWAQSPGTLASQPSKCSSDEQPLEGEPRKDTFCKPEITHASTLNKLRQCVCKPGYVRNAWGICIEASKCQFCKDRPNQDYNPCESACPLTCGAGIPFLCTAQCVAGCACPPGFVRASGGEMKCIPASECPPKCLPNSTFELCKTGCEPVCSAPPPDEKCVPYCSSGACVCKEGYAMLSSFGSASCVPRNECPPNNSK
ncbi:uncharacterized protein LOC144105417 [Amblyomma americanum]